MKNWSFSKWSLVFFSDETNFEVLNRKSNLKVRRKTTEKFNSDCVQQRVQGGGGSIGLWGCINANGAGCCTVYNGRLNSDFYQKIIDDSLLPSIDLFFESKCDIIFQQDNAPCHKSASTIQHLENNGIKVLKWPPRSPDLNPIEHIWNMIDSKLYEISPKNLSELEAAIQKLWNELTPDLCRNLIESMPERIQACINAKGGHFDY